MNLSLFSIIVAKPYFDEAVSGKAGANLEKEFGRLLKEAKEGECMLIPLRLAYSIPPSVC